jgi:hypothetical protein
VRDRGSRNGTSLQGRARVREAALGHLRAVWFGSLGFYLWARPEPPAHAVPSPDVATLEPPAASFRLIGPADVVIAIRAARGHPVDHAPGELEYRAPGARQAKRAPLPRLQFQLLRVLCEAALVADDELAGCVGARELAATLPFQSPRPQPNHVRQVVATLRATLRRAGVPGAGETGGLVQATEGLGYRIAWGVRRDDQKVQESARP